MGEQYFKIQEIIELVQLPMILYGKACDVYSLTMFAFFIYLQNVKLLQIISSCHL